MMRIHIAVAVCALAAAASAGAPAAAADAGPVIDSEPRGARVYVLKGFRRELLGTTPLATGPGFRSPRSILRLEIVKPGYAPHSAEVAAADLPLAVTLSALPVLAASSTYENPRLRALNEALLPRLRAAWPELLSELEPWRPEGPARLADGRGRVLLHVGLEASPAAMDLETASALGARFAAALDGEVAGGLDAVVLAFRHAGALESFAGTRAVTEMACEGGTVATSVWDHCATRSATTSVTTTGTRTEYRCVGGTVTRQVFDPCARRVPRQRTEVAIGTRPAAPRPPAETRAVVAVDRPRLVATCRYADGRRIEAKGATSTPEGEAACPAAVHE